MHARRRRSVRSSTSSASSRSRTSRVKPGRSTLGDSANFGGWQPMDSARRLYRLGLGLGALGVIAVLAAALVASRTASVSDVDRLASTCGRFLLPDLTFASILVLA